MLLSPTTSRFAIASGNRSPTTLGITDWFDAGDDSEAEGLGGEFCGRELLDVEIGLAELEEFVAARCSRLPSHDHDVPAASATATAAAHRRLRCPRLTPFIAVCPAAAECTDTAPATEVTLTRTRGAPGGAGTEATFSRLVPRKSRPANSTSIPSGTHTSTPPKMLQNRSSTVSSLQTIPRRSNSTSPARAAPRTSREARHLPVRAWWLKSATTREIVPESGFSESAISATARASSSLRFANQTTRARSENSSNVNTPAPTASRNTSCAAERSVSEGSE